MIDTPSAGNETVYLGLGTNIGHRQQNIADAITALKDVAEISFQQRSHILETEPWGGVAQPMYLNCTVTVRTTFSPKSLLQCIKALEQKLGRTPTERWGPRVIDIDILLFGERVFQSDVLTVPHAQLVHRDFVLRGLLALNPKLCHPADGCLLQQHLDALIAH